MGQCVGYGVPGDLVPDGGEITLRFFDKQTDQIKNTVSRTNAERNQTDKDQ